MLRKVFELTSALLGPDAHDSKQVKILNRLVCWEDDVGIRYEADPRHAQSLIREILGNNVSSSKAADTPGVREQTDAEEEVLKHIEELKNNGKDQISLNDYETPERKAEIARYRSLAATANSMALDRVDVQFAVKEIARKASCPGPEDWSKLKRLALYLKGKPPVT